MNELDKTFFDEQLHKKDQEIQHLQDLCWHLKLKHETLKKVCAELFNPDSKIELDSILSDIDTLLKK